MLLVFDEIQSGLCRTGALFCYEHCGVSPDIMTLAKPLAGGLPIGATLMSQAVADAVEASDHCGHVRGASRQLRRGHRGLQAALRSGFHRGRKGEGQPSE